MHRPSFGSLIDVHRLSTHVTFPTRHRSPPQIAGGVLDSIAWGKELNHETARVS